MQASTSPVNATKNIYKRKLAELASGGENNRPAVPRLADACLAENDRPAVPRLVDACLASENDRPAVLRSVDATDPVPDVGVAPEAFLELDTHTHNTSHFGVADAGTGNGAPLSAQTDAPHPYVGAGSPLLAVLGGNATNAGEDSEETATVPGSDTTLTTSVPDTANVAQEVGDAGSGAQQPDHIVPPEVDVGYVMVPHDINVANDTMDVEVVKVIDEKPHNSPASCRARTAYPVPYFRGGVLERLVITADIRENVDSVPDCRKEIRRLPVTFDRTAYGPNIVVQLTKNSFKIKDALSLNGMEWFVQAATGLSVQYSHFHVHYVR